MSKKTDISEPLAYWGERVFNSGRVERITNRRGRTGMRLLTPSGGGGARQTFTADGVRARIGAIAKRTPQVMVRISGGGRRVAHVKAHLDYISRNGEIALEDQQGDQFWGRADVNAVRDEWRDGGFPMEDDGPRQAFNIVLSMPAGTNATGLMRAARAFASEEFSKYQYVMALHTPDTDPHPEPAANPHVHLCVKATSLDGTRLNPRKADLQRWREGFAERLREHGIEADASRRIHRLQRVRGEKQSVRHKKARGETLDRIGKAPATQTRVVKAKRSQQEFLGGLRQVAKTLAGSELPADRTLVLMLLQRLGRHTVDPVREVMRDRGPER